MELNGRQATGLWARFATTTAFDDAELMTGIQIDIKSAPEFLIAWAAGMANGDLDALMEMATRPRRGPVQPALFHANGSPQEAAPAAGVEFPQALQKAHRRQPANWRKWPIGWRRRWIAEQVSPQQFWTALPLESAAEALGVSVGQMTYAFSRFNSDPASEGLCVRWGSRYAFPEDRLPDLAEYFNRRGIEASLQAKKNDRHDREEAGA
jgi:hypothetical protein